MVLGKQLLYVRFATREKNLFKKFGTIVCIIFLLIKKENTRWHDFWPIDYSN